MCWNISLGFSRYLIHSGVFLGLPRSGVYPKDQIISIYLGYPLPNDFQNWSELGIGKMSGWGRVLGTRWVQMVSSRVLMMTMILILLIQFHTLESVRESQLRKSQEDSAGMEWARRNQTTNWKQNQIHQRMYYRVILVGTWWHWVIICLYWLEHGGAGSL